MPPTRVKKIPTVSDMDRRLADLVKNGKRFIGKKEYQEILEGKHTTPRKRILAMCYECMGWYEDGTDDCHQDTCPLYSMMPYNKKNKDKVKNDTG